MKNKLFLLIYISIFSMSSIMLSNYSFFKEINLSPLIIAILLGMIITNVLRIKFFTNDKTIISFCTKEVLRFAIILYGFRLTFQDILNVGIDGFLVSFTMLISTFAIGYIVGVKFLNIDKHLTILISAGSSICGAAAILATEGVLKNKSYKSAIAVSTVVLFGTFAMFLYPYLYKLSFFNLSQEQMAIYLGATLHEVAHVVGSANAIGGEVIPYDAVVAKMIRVMLIAPFLLFLPFLLKKDSNKKSKIIIPWFAVFFILVSLFNSFDLLNENLVEYINTFDTFLLCVAMFVLGLNTDFKTFKEVGIKPLLLAFVLFIWLLVGGFYTASYFI